MPDFIVRIFFRKLLNTRKGRRWHDRLNAHGNLTGAPVDAKKLWNAFKRDIKPHLRHYPRLRHFATTQWIRIRTAGVRVRVQTIKPVKPARKFIITLIDMPQSVQATEQCIESAKRYGEDHNLEIMPAIDKFEAHDFFVRHNLTWEKGYPSINPLPEMGCFASHFTLWLRCMEMGEPIIALEHDSRFRAPIPALRFKHLIMLAERRFEFNERGVDNIKSHKAREIFHPWTYLIGTHGYAITPEGARRLVKAARCSLLLPVDRFIQKKYVDILYYHPYPVDLDEKFSTTQNKQNRGLDQDNTWKDYKSAPSSGTAELP